MKKQTVIWTALPNGVRSEDGKLLISVHVSPRLRYDDKPRPNLGDFPDFQNWAANLKQNAIQFTVAFGNGYTAPAEIASLDLVEPQWWGALFPPEIFVRSYEEEEHERRTIISYPVRSVLHFVKDRYRKLGLEYPTHVPPSRVLRGSDYFGPIQLPRNLEDEFSRIRLSLRQQQQQVVQAVRSAYTRYRLSEGGTAIAGGTTSDREPDPQQRGELPSGLEEHRDAINQQNQQKAADAISGEFGDFGRDTTDGQAPQPAQRADGQEARGGPLPDAWPTAIELEEIPDPLRDFVRAGLFQQGLRPKEEEQPGGESRAIQPLPAVPELDFHEGLSSLESYPQFVRRYGMVIDLAVAARPGIEIPERSTVRVFATWNPEVETQNVSPRTHYTTRSVRNADSAEPVFLPAPRPTNPEVIDGRVNLSNTAAYVVEQIDPDNAAASLLSYANNRLRTAGDAEVAPPPSLTSGGIALVRSNAAVQLMQSFASTTLRNKSLQDNPDELAFYAEDLVQGYRVDVWDETDQEWLPLNLRLGQYSLLNLPQAEQVKQFLDEGWVSQAGTSSGRGTTDDLHVHEMLCNWNGWSLSTPPPLFALGPDGSVQEVDNQAVTDFKFEARMENPAEALPVLRFGHAYRVKARTVDIAGNSVTRRPDDDFFAASNPLTFRRFEPLSPPNILQLAPPWEADSQTTVMLRTNYDLPTTQAVWSRLATEKGGDVNHGRRHFAPPRTSMLMAERHGAFDTAEGMAPALFAEAFDRVGVGFALYEPGLQHVVPYIPDPIARGVLFYNLPWWPAGEPFRVAFDTLPRGWPDARTVLLQVVDPEESGLTGPVWDAASRTLKVPVAKADIHKISYASYMDPADLDLMGHWHLLIGTDGPVEEQPTLEQVEAWRQEALASQRWLLTPQREFTIGNVVKQPLLPPQVQRAAIARDLGETSGLLSGELTFDGKSSRLVAVEAMWEEYDDDPDEDDIAVTVVRVPVYEAEVRDRATNLVRLNKHHDFGDTRYRLVRYQARAATRFRHYFPKEWAAEEFIRIGDPTYVDALNAARPAPPRVRYVIPTFGWERPSATSSIRRGRGIRVYLERPWLSSGVGEQLGVLIRDKGLSNLPQRLKGQVTEWARDPLWQSGTLPDCPRVEHFPAAAATQSNLTLADLEDETETFTVAGHEVQYDATRKLWYADIEIDTGEAYFPFVRLALVRYQPRSVAGAHISSMVMTDFVQVAPDRAASVTVSALDPNRADVTVIGPVRPKGQWGYNFVEVTLERQARGGSSELKWERVDRPPLQLKRDQDRWYGTVTLPGESGHTYRVVIKEYETFETDQTATAGLLERRLVFADALVVRE